MREAVSREASVYVGLDEAHLFPKTVSREVSVFVGQGFTNHFPEVISRECTVMNPTTEAPSAITNFTLSVSPTGERATLSWSNYNELAQLDLTRYDIYRRYNRKLWMRKKERILLIINSRNTRHMPEKGYVPWKKIHSKKR